MDWVVFLRLLHLLGAFLFVGVHGATAAVTFRLMRERNPVRVRAYLELSRTTRTAMYLSFLLLLGAGLALTYARGWEHTYWPWVSLALLLALFGAAIPLAVPYYRAVRLAAEADPPDLAKLGELLDKPRGLVLAMVETTGIVIIIYLMVYKPF